MTASEPHSFIFNMSNVSRGGGLQVGLSIIDSFLSDLSPPTAHFILSRTLVERLKSENLVVPQSLYTQISAGGINGKIQSRKALNECVEEHNASIVFSLFGPTYWRPKSKIRHVVGFANAWVLPIDRRLYRRLSKMEQVKRKLKYTLMAFDFKRTSDYLLVEANHVKKKLNQHLLLKDKHIMVAPNAAREIFYEERLKSEQLNALILLKQKYPDLKIGAYVAAHYVHKNFDLIGQLSELNNPLLGLINFAITIEAAEYEKLCQKWPKISHITTNLGRLNSKEVRALYEHCDFGFMPSLLECNTAALHEYIAMRLPIVSAYFDYAREICENAAFYFDPYNVNSTKLAINAYLNDPKQHQSKIEKLRRKGRGYSAQRWATIKKVLTDQII